MNNPAWAQSRLACYFNRERSFTNVLETRTIENATTFATIKCTQLVFLIGKDCIGTQTECYKSQVTWTALLYPFCHPCASTYVVFKSFSTDASLPNSIRSSLSFVCGRKQSLARRTRVDRASLKTSLSRMTPTAIGVHPLLYNIRQTRQGSPYQALQDSPSQLPQWTSCIASIHLMDAWTGRILQPCWRLGMAPVVGHNPGSLEQ